MHKTSVLGVRVDNVSINDLLNKNNKKLFVATVNSSFILKCQNNKKFLDILNNCTNLNTIDSVSILMALSFFSRCSHYNSSNIFLLSLLKPFVFIYYGVLSGFNYKSNIKYQRLTGVFLLSEVLKYANKNKMSLLVFHREDSHITKSDISNFVTSNYPNINIGVKEVSIKQFNKPISNKVRSNFIFCTFGEYWQETFLQTNLKSLNSNLLVGIGGAFDVLIGKVKISNKASQLGLEWFIRLLYNPKRFLKIFRSVFVFPWKIYIYSLKAF